MHARKVISLAILVLLVTPSLAPAAAPARTRGNQYRADTAAAIPFTTGTVPIGVGVYFECDVFDADNNTVKMEVELHRLPAAFTGVANYSSGYVDSGRRARTSTATGLTAGNYGWRYRAVDSTGVASTWVVESNPDFIVEGPNETPTHGVANQVRADTQSNMAIGATVPQGVSVYFRVPVADADGDTVRMEVELRQLPATFSGTPNYTSSYVSSGSTAATPMAAGLSPGNYGWRYRVVDSRGAAGPWVSESNPDFIVQANQPPTHGVASQIRADTGASIPDPGGTIPYGVNVCFRVTPTDPEGDTVRMEVELHQLPASFTGTPNYVSPYVTSGSEATTTSATGLAAGNYGWKFRVVDSRGAATAWSSAGNPDFVAQTVPTLSISCVGTNLTLSWPASADCYVLQQTRSLTPPVSWSTVTNTPVLFNDVATVATSTAEPQLFYRLINTYLAVPTLQMAPAGSAIQVSWPSWAHAWSLESTSNASPLATWSPVTAAPTTIGGQTVLTIDPTEPRRFYRLTKAASP